MAIMFRQVSCPPIQGLDATAPGGALIGVIGEEGAGKGRLLRLAAGLETPVSGVVEAGAVRRFLGPGDALDFSSVEVLAMEHTLARHDAVVRQQAAASLDRLRRAGATVLLVSHEEELLRQLADEVWWLDHGKAGGARRSGRYPARLWLPHRAAGAGWGQTVGAELTPRMRRGDGRAEITGLELIGESGQPTVVARSGELVVARVRVRFHQQVADPVVGLMIRSRAGMNVYGTNTGGSKA